MHDDEYAWELPEELKKVWKGKYDATAEEQTFPLEAVIRGPVRGKT